MQERRILIDGKCANLLPNMRYRGSGMVSANNSSRLLLDYKALHPEIYERLLHMIFGNEGMGITHLKLELGADINSSSGTEPATKRATDAPADVRRGAGFQFAADAKRINPELTLDLLRWSEPRWITDAPDRYAARYRWFRETLNAAYDTYGLRFDYISAEQNERGCDPAWIKYLSAHLKAETDCRYDYSSIRIVAGDAVCTWEIADKMCEDPELMAAVDVIGSHYTSFSSENALRCAREFGKELWFSEASSPMGYPQGAARFDGSGLCGINGMLDIAARLISMYAGGGMTLCEYQPVVAAYYDGVTYCCKHLILANTPWNGYFLPDIGYYMMLHFSKFFRKGWTFLDGANYTDGIPGGDGHALVNTRFCYMTAADPESGDYSCAVVNSTKEPIRYRFAVRNLARPSAYVSVWETRGPADDVQNMVCFRQTACIRPEISNGEAFYEVTVQPESLVTVSTLACARPYDLPVPENTVMPLPYREDFSYPAAFLRERGGAPLYTTDIGGAFEVVHAGGRQILRQQITAETKAAEWGWTSEPVTCFGDDRWYNCCAECTVLLAKNDMPADVYAGLGLRYVLGDQGHSGWWLALFADGTFQVRQNDCILHTGTVSLSPDGENRLLIGAKDAFLWCSINGMQVYTADASGAALPAAGRAALYSSYHQNGFADIQLNPLPDAPFAVTRFDDTDACMIYSGAWDHALMAGFRHFCRTHSTGGAGDSVEFSFRGTGYAVTGETAGGAVLRVIEDGKCRAAHQSVPKCAAREISVQSSAMQPGMHHIKIVIESGSWCVDSLETLP